MEIAILKKVWGNILFYLDMSKKKKLLGIVLYTL